MTLLLLSGCSRTWCRQLNGGLVACGDFMCQWISLYVLSRHHWHPFQIHKSRSNFNRFEMTWTMFRLPKFKINFNFGVLKNVPSRGIWSDLTLDIILWSFRNVPSGLPLPPTSLAQVAGKLPEDNSHIIQVSVVRWLRAEAVSCFTAEFLMSFIKPVTYGFEYSCKFARIWVCGFYWFPFQRNWI